MMQNQNRAPRVGLLAAFSMMLASAASAQTVAPCTTGCARLEIVDASAAKGGTAVVGVRFEQGANDSQTGGIDNVAALAFTLEAPGDGSGGLSLAQCAAGADPTLPAAVQPTAALAGYRLVLENYRCDEGRTHCLCPDSGSGITPDDFLNLVVYGPDPLPAPGSGTITVPALPSGTLFAIQFRVADSAIENQVIPLHVLNQVSDAEKGQFRAFLSLGDTQAVDQTCVPVAGTPPCTAANARSQVTVDDGQLTVLAGSACTGDCDASADVTVDEIITLVNIALGNQTLTNCTAGDANTDGQVTVDEIVAAVNNALNGCPG